MIILGTVAQWLERACSRLERATDDRVVLGSNPTEAAWKLWQFTLLHFPGVFWRTL